MPFSFHIEASAEAIASGAPARLVITNSIDQDALNHPSDAFSPEDIFVVKCSPQAVFKVRPATRCSSTLSGALHSVLGPIVLPIWPTGSLTPVSFFTCRSHISDIMRIILSNRKPSCDGFRRL